MIRKLLALLAFILLFNNGLRSQAPWCDGFHYYQNSNLGGYSSSNYVIAIEQVRIRQDNNILYNHAADGYSGGATCGQEYRLSNPVSKAFNLKTGHAYTIDANSSSAYSYHANFGVFIDFNNDKDFLDPGEYLGTWSDVNNGPFKQSVLKSKDFVIPCSAKIGPSRLRLVCNYNVYTMNASYGCTSCSGPPYYGETVDFSINIVKPDSTKVDFIVPSNMWIKTVRQFVNKNSSGYLQHAWDINNDGQYDQIGSKPNYSSTPTTWTIPGNKCVKLRGTTCLGTDSIIKCFNVSAPNSIPAVDFIASSTSITQYEVVKLFDLSDFGPYKWSWDVYDSTTYASIGYFPSIASGDVIPNPSYNGLDEFTSTPEFEIDLPGCYTVVLTAVNDVGPSIPKKKICYIRVNLPNNYNIGFGTYGPNGDNYVQSPTGIISDNGGPFLNYDNNQGMGSRSFLCITPCNAKKIKLHLSQLKFKDNNDVLKVWDGNNAGGPNTTLLGVYSYLSKSPIDLVATSGSLFILFESDGVGTDSGFLGEYSSELGPPTMSPLSFSPDVQNLFEGRPITFNNTSSNLIGIPEWEWTIDSASVPNNKGMHLRHIFDTPGNYKVCLNMHSCAGNQIACSTYTIYQANISTSLDVIPSKVKTIPYETISLKLLSEVANRFEITINPGNFKLFKPLQSPSYQSGNTLYLLSTPGDSMPLPEIQFTSAGCYNITIKAYNYKDKNNTTRTIVKKDLICVLDYCKPVAYYFSNEIGINKVRLSKDTSTLLEKISASGSNSYSDYTGTVQAHLRHCATYQLEIDRFSHLDSVNIGAYVDWNIDGDFDDHGEQIASIYSSVKGFETIPFSVPDKSTAGLGKTRLRVVTTYTNQTPSPCGPFWLGEAEDYTLWIDRDSIHPNLQLVGPDTIKIERGGNYVELGAISIDNLQGDISKDIIITTDLDPSVTGLYQFQYTSCDCSDNCITKSRIVIVVSDIPPPVIQLNPGPPGCIEARRDNDPYVDPGAYAYAYAPLTNLTNNIIVSGSVDTRKIGNYTITYKVTDIRGATTIEKRQVCVEDQIAPQIITPLDTNIQLGSIWFDPTYAMDAFDLNPELLKIWKSNHSPNPYHRAVNSVKYVAYDASGNYSDTVVVHYKIDDFIDPVINLNTENVVYHEVRTVYNSIPVTVTDNYYGPDQTVVRRIFSDVDEFKIGIYYEIFEAVDGSGNFSKKTRTVIVRDQIAPRIWANSMQGCVGEAIWPYWQLYVMDNYYTAQELKPFIQILSQNVNIWEEGIYTITYRVTDPSGNSSEPFTRYVNITYPPNCHNSSTDLVQIDSTSKSIKIYPNPASQNLNIECIGLTSFNTEIQILDMTGRMVLSSNLNGPVGLIDISALPQGLYTLEVKNGDLIERRTITVMH